MRLAHTAAALSLFLMVPVAQGADPFADGKSFADGKKQNQKQYITTDNAKDKIPGFTDKPELASTYKSGMPPRAQGDAKIQLCRMGDPTLLTATEKLECNAINFLVDQHDKQNPFTFDKKNEVLFKNFKAAKDSAERINSDVCQFESQSADYDKAEEKTCEEELGRQLYTCEENLKFVPQIANDLTSNGTAFFSLDYTFLTDKVYVIYRNCKNCRWRRRLVRDDALPQSIPLDIIYRYSFGGSATPLKVAGDAKDKKGNRVYLMSPFPSNYANFVGTAYDDAERVNSFTNNAFPATSVNVKLEKQIKPTDGWQMILWNNGKDFYQGDTTRDGFELYASSRSCSESKCFSRQPQESVEAVTTESGKVIGFQMVNETMFYSTPVTDPRGPITYSAKSGMNAGGSEYGAPFTIYEDRFEVPFYAGIRSAYAIASRRTKAVVAYVEGVVKSDGELIASFYDGKSGASVCTASMGFVRVADRRYEDREKILLKDLTTKWFDQVCTSEAAQKISAELTAIDGTQLMIPAINGNKEVYIFTTVNGHKTSVDNTYQTCPSMIPAVSPLRTKIPTGAPGVTHRTTYCLEGGKVASPYTASIDPKVREDYPFKVALVNTSNVIELWEGNCNGFRAQE